ncbi:MAG: pilus assembly protein N-terminal domain-containing protein [Sumerlaeia bacterium]
MINGFRWAMLAFSIVIATAAFAQEPPLDAANTERTRLSRMDPLPIGSRPPEDAGAQQLLDRFIERIVDPELTLDLVAGRPRLMMLKQRPLRVQIPGEDIATYDLVTDRQILVTGKETGTTILTLWFPDPENADEELAWSYLVRVFPDPEARERLERVYEALEREINEAFPNSYVELILVGDKLVVRGEAYDILEANQILKVVEANAPGKAETIPVDRIELNLEDLGPDGLPPQALENFLISTKANIINALTIPGEAQVMLRVVVAEVNRSALRSIGVNFDYISEDGTVMITNLTGGIREAGLVNVPFNIMEEVGEEDPTGYELDAALNILRSLNLAKSLAEPNLVTLNGRKASFLAGGQFPIPVVTGATNTGLQGVEFVPFGVQLEFTPFVTERDRIRLSINAEVSTRQTASGTSVGNSSIPGLDTRTFQTTVDLRDGQTLAVAGLLQTNFGSTADRVPILGDLPIVGAMFGFNRTSASEQELIILVSPSLVYPMEEGEVPPLPGSDMNEPSDLEFYLLNRLESLNLFDEEEGGQERLRAFQTGDEQFIEGPSGYTRGRSEVEE